MLQFNLAPILSQDSTRSIYESISAHFAFTRDETASSCMRAGLDPSKIDLHFFPTVHI
jgi:hypothetical protein